MAQPCEAHHGDYSLIDDEAIFIQYSESYLTIIREVVILLVSNCITSIFMC